MHFLVHIATAAVCLMMLLKIQFLHRELATAQQQLSRLTMRQLHGYYCSSDIYNDSTFTQHEVFVAGERMPCLFPRLDFAAPGVGYKHLPPAFCLLAKTAQLPLSLRLTSWNEILKSEKNTPADQLLQPNDLEAEPTLPVFEPQPMDDLCRN